MKTGSVSIKAIMRRRRILFAGFVTRMEDTRLPKCVMFAEIVGGAGCVERVSPGRPQSFRYQRRPAATQDEGEWRNTAEQGAERFMAKWIAPEVCPDVRGRTKERIVQSKRARAGSLVILVFLRLVY